MTVREVPGSPTQGLAVRPASGLGLAASSSRRQRGRPTRNQLVAAFRAEKRRREQIQPAEEPDRGFMSEALRTAGSGAMAVLGSDVAQNILSGEEFINTIGGFAGLDDLGSDIRDRLEDVPTIGGFLGVAFDVGASPLTLITAGSGGLAAGVSSRALGRFGVSGIGAAIRPAAQVPGARLAGRVVKGVAEPIIPEGRFAQKALAETIVGTGAEYGFEKAGIGAGLIGGFGGFRGIRLAQKGALGAKLLGKPRTGLEGIGSAAARGVPVSGPDYVGTRSFPEQVMTFEFNDAIDSKRIANEFDSTIGDILKGNSRMWEAGKRQAESLKTQMHARQSQAMRKMAPYLEKNEFGQSVIKDLGDPEVPVFMLDDAGNRVFADDRIILNKYIASMRDPKWEEWELKKLLVRPGKSQVGKVRTLSTIPQAVREASEELLAIREHMKKEADVKDVFIELRGRGLGQYQDFFPRRIKQEYVGGVPQSTLRQKESLHNERVYETFEEGYQEGTKDLVSIPGKPGEFTGNGFLYKDVPDALDEYIDEMTKEIQNHEMWRALYAVSEPSGKQSLDKVFLGPESLKHMPNRFYAHRQPMAIGEVGPRQEPVDWSKRYFDEGFRDRVAKYVAPSEAHPGSQDPMKINGVMRQAEKINQTLKPTMAGFDWSAILLTLAQITATIGPANPRRFAQIINGTFKDMEIEGIVGKFDGEYEKFFLSEEATEAAPYIKFIDPGDPKELKEYVFGGVNPENSSWYKKLGAQIAGPFSRHFVMSGNRMRVEGFHQSVKLMEDSIRASADQAGKALPSGWTLDEAAKMAIGRATDRAGGLATSAPGIVERNALFAANFYRSMFESFGQAVMNGSLEGDIARRYFTTFASNALMLVAAVSIVRGEDPATRLAVFDGESLKEGELRLNPNFGTVHVPGVDREISVLGPWDSNIRLLVTLGEAAIDFGNEPDVQVMQDFLGQVARQKGSPAVSAVSNILTQETYSGRSIFTPTGAVEATPMPFAFSGLVDDLADGQEKESAVIGAFFSMLGMKERPLSPTDRLNLITNSDERFRTLYRNLTPDEKDLVLEENPKVAELYAIAKQRADSPEGQYLQWLGDHREELRNNEVDFYIDFQSNPRMSRTEFKDSLQRMRRTYFDFAEMKRNELELTFDQRAGTPSAALGAYYDLYRDSKDLSGQIDWDLYELKKAELDKQISTGKFGDPLRAREFIEERREFQVAPELQWFEDNMDYIRETTMQGHNYWDQLDRAFAKYSKRIELVAHREVKSHRDLKASIRVALQQGDKRTAMRLDNFRRMIEALRTKYRKVMRRKDKKLDEALKENGYLDDLRLSS